MRVLIADEHRIFRQGVREILKQAGHTVVGEAGDGQEAVRLARMLVPDVVVLELSVPRLNGVETAREVRRQLPLCKAVLLTEYSDRAAVFQALKAGVKGYVLKNQAPSDLLHALREVWRGRVYLGPGMAEYVVEACIDNPTAQAPDLLTARERQVLQLIAEGSTTREVALQLNIGFKTAESHRHHIMKKLDLHDVAGLVRYAIHRGLVRAEFPARTVQEAPVPTALRWHEAEAAMAGDMLEGEPGTWRPEHESNVRPAP